MSKFIEIIDDNDSKVLINLNDIKEIKIEDTDYTNTNVSQLVLIRNNDEKIILDEGDYKEMENFYDYLSDEIEVTRF